MLLMLWTMLAVIAVALAYIWIPVGVGSYRTVRNVHALPCPETGESVQVQLDAIRAGLTAPLGLLGLRVTACSEWPQRGGCDRACTRSVPV